MPTTADELRISDWISDGCSSDLQVENEIGGLGHDRRWIVADRGDDGLDRFLAQLLRDLGAAPGEKAGDIGGVGVSAPARSDQRFERVKLVGSHARWLAQDAAKVNPCDACRSGEIGRAHV